MVGEELQRHIEKAQNKYLRFFFVCFKTNVVIVCIWKNISLIGSKVNCPFRRIVIT